MFRKQNAGTRVARRKPKDFRAFVGEPFGRLGDRSPQPSCGGDDDRVATAAAARAASDRLEA